jgi:cyclopropane fatty-acyl-phospholipid synthase-like methyltransferase
MSAENDPTTPEFWNRRFREARIAWDAGSTPAELDSYLAKRRAGDRVLIPGCGSAYEVRSFSEKGDEVVAIDFSAAAVEKARRELGQWGSAVVMGDFFSYDFGQEPFDIIYERAFLASLPRERWNRYAARVKELLQPGGNLIGFFVFGEHQGGPPFCLKEGELAELLGEAFEKLEEVVVATSVPVFQGKERWQVWVRTD